MNAATVREQRADAQRDRILSAAQKCFADRGFHGAGMALIAETAGISPGLIYRYFSSKSDIIQGIVRRQLQAFAQQLLRPDGLRKDLATTLHDGFYGSQGNDEDGLEMQAALVLEISAEAGRDDGIAEVLRDFDLLLDKAARQWIQNNRAPRTPALSDKALAARSLMLRCFIDGLKVRQAREPGLDPQLLHDALDEFLDCLRR